MVGQLKLLRIWKRGYAPLLLLHPAPRKSIKEQVSIAKLETEKLQAENKKLKDNPQRRKSSTLLAPFTYQRPMKTLKDFRFCISLRPLFSESGKLAAEFELKQFFIIVAQVIPCLIYLLGLFYWEPLTMLIAISSTLGLAGSGNAAAVGNTTNVTSMFDDDDRVNTYPNITSLYAEELISVIDPVGYTSVIFPSMLAWMMACGFIARLVNYFMPRRAILELLAGYVVILSVCYISTRFVSKLMGSNISFYVVDILHIAVGYVSYIIYASRVDLKYKPKSRYK